jgi:membrane-bound lytic murein transglycosylase F
MTLAATAGAADLAEIKARGSLRVLVFDRSDEFFSLKPGTPPGFDHELLTGFASLHRIRLEVTPLPSWGDLIPALLQGKGDLVAGRFTVTPARSEQIAFTIEVFPTRNVVVTRRPHRVVHTLEEFRVEKVGTIRGTSMAEAIAAAGVPPAHIDDTIPWGTLPEAVAAGKVTAVVLGVENAIVAQRKDPDLQLGLFLGPPGALAYGVRKQDAQLLGALNEYVGNTRKTLTWNRLVVKYLGPAALEALKRSRTE